MQDFFLLLPFQIYRLQGRSLLMAKYFEIQLNPQRTVYIGSYIEPIT